jgi:methionine-rich copper-binding protein CopC
MAINTSSLLGCRDVFFIDASLPDLFTLTSALSADAEIHFIDATQDGLEQIALTLRGLQGESGIDAIHIFSHGSAGELSIGSTTLSSYNINSYAATLSQIGSALSPAGDILLYGCNVAAGDEGRAFVESVARLTQADVAASDDVTGSAALGGDWILENNSDAIEAKGLFVPEWTGMLGDDYADDRAGATVLTLGVAKSGNIEVVSDQDYFKVDLVAGQRYLFEMTASGIGSLDTAYLHLNTASDFYVASGYNSDLATFSYVATNSGTVYLEASELGDDSIGSYTIKASLVNVTHEPTGVVTITGTTTQGQTLTATNTLADSDGVGSISYQWNANETVITGATGSSLTLTEALVGKQITVTAIYTDGQGTYENIVSAATNIVSSSDTTSPTLTATRPSDDNLTASATEPIVLTFSEAIQKGIATIAIHSGSATGPVVASSDDATSATVTVSGSTLTINPTHALAYGTHYYVTVGEGSIYDAAHNSYAGTDSYDFTTAAAASIHDLTGSATFWKTGLPITAVTSTFASSPAVAGTQVIEFRNIQTASDGSRTLEIWVTSPTVAINSVQLDLALQTGSTATWQDATGLPAGWSSSANTDKPGQFIFGGIGLTALSVGSVKLGTLTLTAPANPQHFDLSLTTGLLGNDTISAFGISSDSMTTGTDGLYQHLDMADGTYSLTSAKVSGTDESNAVKANDALAALKIAVGMNPNADGSAVSPYQYLAADVNHDGQVKAADALNILKMAVKLSTAPEKEWLFVPESVGSESMSRNHVVWPDNPIPVTLDMDQDVHLIGIVKGDVNGSWAAA